jgi:hypothetical protein
LRESLLDTPATLEDGDILADWAEALLFLEDRRFIPRDELRRRLGGGDLEVAVGLLLEQVRVRAANAPASYPFRREPGGMRLEPSIDRTLYEFLLWLSMAGSPARRLRAYRAVDAYFDRVVLKALCSYLGPFSTGVRFGAPASHGRPKGYRDALEWLAERMEVSPQGSLPPNDAKKDGGVDVIVWLPLPDHRADYVAAIAQCTVMEAWPDKIAQVFTAARCWGGGWIGLARDPLAVLAVPFAVPRTHPRFEELRWIIPVLLDRMRLCHLARNPFAEDRDYVSRWLERVRRAFRNPQAVRDELDKPL